jgi:uncharacterized Fe-S cluster protein YjdI
MSSREYKSNDITVYFEPRLCIHSRNCVRGLRAVFNTSRKPWIQPDNASADEIARVVETCPTGALHYKRHDGKQDESADAKMTVTVVPGGPLHIRGNIEIKNDQGEVIRKHTRLALCRCGKSENKPYCDGTHVTVDFE